MHQEVTDDHLGIEAVSSKSSKDADYASPVSILKTPFVWKASSCSENSGRVSTEVIGMNFIILCLCYVMGRSSFSVCPCKLQ